MTGAVAVMVLILIVLGFIFADIADAIREIARAIQVGFSDLAAAHSKSLEGLSALAETYDRNQRIARHREDKAKKGAVE